MYLYSRLVPAVYSTILSVAVYISIMFVGYEGTMLEYDMPNPNTHNLLIGTRI